MKLIKYWNFQMQEMGVYITTIIPHGWERGGKEEGGGG